MITTGGTAISLLTPSAVNVTHIIPPGGLNIYNQDTVPATVTVSLFDGATERILYLATLQPDASLNNVGPIHLTAITQTLKVKLAVAATTTELPVEVSYYIVT
jgi:hypothetical protein